MPARTSPEPAVPSQAGALALMAARPSGLAMTVSLPLRMMTAPERCGGRARLFELAAGHVAEQALEFALMRGQHHGTAGSALMAAKRVSASSVKAGERVGIEHGGGAGGEDGQHAVAGLVADARRPGR